jgi:hypothetical protein
MLRLLALLEERSRYLPFRFAEVMKRKMQKVLRGFGTTVPLTLQLLKPILSAVKIYPACRSIGESLSKEWDG